MSNELTSREFRPTREVNAAHYAGSVLAAEELTLADSNPHAVQVEDLRIARQRIWDQIDSELGALAAQPNYN